MPRNTTTAEAVEFIRAFFADQQRPAETAARITQVLEETAATGTYRHTTAELRFGCRLAWRQASRCIGRAWNPQLFRYAGYRALDGSVLGDPGQAAFTETVARLGWQPPAVRGRFDLLPWVIETAGEKPRLVEFPPRIVDEVQLSHPRYPWFADLGLRWHVLPVISNMRLRIGGVDYSCAPFSGFYLGDEIATRNFGDVGRYNMLPEIAARLGLDSGDRAGMWGESAALVHNQAVLSSFIKAGVSIADGFSESKSFVAFAAREESLGRTVFGEWPWINGHFGHSLGPAFHRYYDESIPATGFFTDPSRLDGGLLVDRWAQR